MPVGCFQIPRMLTESCVYLNCSAATNPISKYNRSTSFPIKKSTNMQILITGISGRVGANVATTFIRNGHNVRGLVWRGDRQAEKIALIGADIVEGDLASSSEVAKSAQGSDAIFHLGAAFQAGGPFTPEQYLDINVKGTFNVLEAALAQQDRLKHVIVTSTDGTMDKYPPDGIAEPLSEESLPLTTTSWYGYSKILTEHLVDRYVRAESMPATVFRFANAWGAGEAIDFPQFHLRTFIGQLKDRRDDEGTRAYKHLTSVYEGDPHFIVALDESGKSWKKHLVEVRDLVHAYEMALGNPSTFGKTYQLASREPFRWDEMIPYIADKMKAPWTSVRLPVTPTHYEYDTSAAFNDFGYAPDLTLTEIVDEAYRFKSEGGGEIIPTTL